MEARRNGTRWQGAAAGAALLALVGAVGAARAAGYDPAWTWRTIETPHFHIHYHDGLEGEAAELARIAEEVHGPMVEVLGWAPREPTEVTLVDDTDLANGYATVLPYNQLVMYPVRPGLFQGIGEYAGWLKTLFVHEYAHVLGLDPVRGYPEVLRSVFGRVGVPVTPGGALFWFFAAPPNVFLPPWFHEGLAINLETDLTGRGRKGSTWYRMVYRSAVAEGTIPPLDRLGGDFPEWPGFSTRYLYGARLLQRVEERHGRDALGRLATGHSGRFPYATARPPITVTGTDYQGLYREMVAELEAEYGPEVEALRRQGLTPHRTVTRSGYLASGPRWLGPDALAYTRAGPYRPPELLRVDLTSGRETALAERPGGATPPTPLGDGRLAFSRVEVTRPWAGGRRYSDLYAVGAGGEDLVRLTRGARLREADWSPRAGVFAAVRVGPAGQALVRLAPGGAETDAVRVLLEEP
ncbi:MAG: TolB family protein, partial [Deferrisomatales bacterium]